ncbi:MAG TPA: biotin/lipoyl-binding protein [Allosphingosinicella sp.]|jgi:multidrug efflux pump subunit AcrA (membrane-fusion protein)|uniref:efflux RND transporter periplasmic adaptor subunit n=1 Tax=Allosphingosinicella sp. TaxID=2823234 RepID=UPI002F2AACF1
MALKLPRHILPFAALAALGGAVFVVATTQPDRTGTVPAKAPPAAPAAQRAGTVSGAGVIEPSSELIEIGVQRPGVVTQVAVQVGDRVSKGQLLFAIDAREAERSVGEARTSVQLARERVEAARVELASAQRLLDLVTSVDDPRAVARQEIIDRRAQRDAARARLEVARAEVAQGQAQLASAQTGAGLLAVRAPRSATVLQVNTREGQYATAGPGPGNQDPLMVLGETVPLHVRVDIDESEIGRARIGAPAVVSPRGQATRRVQARYVRTEPLVVPKRSLTNSGNERVDVRVLQLVFALPDEARGFFVGQQVDAFIPAEQPQQRAAQAAARPKQ